MVSETEREYVQRTRVRWAVYNLAFRVFGNTRLWRRLGPSLW